MNNIYLLLIFFLFQIVFTGTKSVSEEKPSEYRVVLDPGHGGLLLQPQTLHGDRYDPLSGKYLSSFRPGAVHAGLRESVLMYSIAEKAEKYLRLTYTRNSFSEFIKIMSKYGIKPVGHSVIKTYVSRDKSITPDSFNETGDPNGPYRIFDYPAADGSTAEGRMTYINRMRPQLVISLHCDYSPSPKHQGFAAIILPPFSSFKSGLEHYSKPDRGRFFSDLPREADCWLLKTNNDPFASFVNDSILYFSSYQLNLPEFEIDSNQFLGYKQNMIKWSYSDFPYWKKEAFQANGPYSRDPRNFTPETRFWKREMSVYENYKRDGGPEGYGGDNNYAASEIIRYMLAALEMRGIKDVYAKDPYYSSWLLPVLLNAINAYIEIGYLTDYRFRFILTEKSDAIAEAVAVAAYSLLAETSGKNSGLFINPPKKERINLDKYNINNTSYFDLVGEQ